MKVDVKPTFVCISGKPVPFVSNPYHYTAYNGNAQINEIASDIPLGRDLVEAYRKNPIKFYKEVTE